MSAVRRKPPLKPPQTTVSPPLKPPKMHVSPLSFPTALFFTLLLFRHVTGEPIHDKQQLLSFISKLPHASRIHWNTSVSACTWIGVTCDSTNSSVIHLRLPAAGLVGAIPANTVGKLTKLRVLSLRSNKLSGKLPHDFSNLILLRSLYLQNNLFTGEFPPTVSELTRLTRVDLSGNNFSGSVPFSINNLTQLAGLMLQNNRFSSELPNFNQKSLISVNISNNKLNGSIPMSLSRFPASAFSGNVNLCGKPLPPCDKTLVPPPIPAPSMFEPPRLKKNGKKLSTGAIIAIAIGSALILGLLLLILLLRVRRKRNQRIKQTPEAPASAAVGSRAIADAGTSSSKDELTAASMNGEKNKLVLVTAGIYSFDLEDLLRASAEVLGKGSVGTSYKAVLEDGTTVVVKRLKDVTATKKEFETQMQVLAGIDNENVVPLRAFYYSKDEKLLVSDFMAAGSLSALLHGKVSGRTQLDWDHRMKIAISVAKGVAYLHVAMNVVHGNIKSSNIFFQETTNTGASVSDYGLNPLLSGSSTPNNRVFGYRAPEVLEIQKVTFKSDVYSFGVLLLELLTGKSPQTSLGEEGLDLPRWVQSIMREEWTAEVFDVELMAYNDIEEEMVRLLQIAMACVSTVPDQRPTMQEVVKMLEDINRAESTDDGLRQSSDDPSKGSDGHTPPTETQSSP